MRTAYRTCPLCEATCGLELTIDDDRITRIRGDRDHVFSRGFLCPKGAAFGKLVHDPDRLRRPLVRKGEGFVEVSWDEAFDAVRVGLGKVVAEHGREAVATYAGNPSSHTMAGELYLVPFLRALGARSTYTASTVDQMPKVVSSAYLFGHILSIPVPDIDRTDLLVVLGANPYESNGSLMTAPDFPGRVDALHERGGRMIVVDPRRTKTAGAADEHLAIRPGRDALLLFAVVHTLFADDLVDLGRLRDHVIGVGDVDALAAGFAPERVAAACGIDAERIRRLAHELTEAPSAAVYGRIGASTVPFGTLTNWLVDVVNILTGNLDRPGGAMFPLPPHRRRHTTGPGRHLVTGRWTTRVRELPEYFGQLPVAALAEEIETPGEGRIRALVTMSGNPVLSTPNGERLDRALASLDFMVSVDPYLNETTRHADVILPPTDSARISHYDFQFLGFAVRNMAAFSPPVLPADDGGMDECDIFAHLAVIVGGEDTPIERFHEDLLRSALDRSGLDRGADELRPLVEGDSPAERLLDVAVRTGAYGDRFGEEPDGLSLARLRDDPHGIDLGPLQPRIPEILRTPSGAIELCHPALAADVPRLAASIDEIDDGQLVLIGRRHIRSNNSWMHNVEVLVKGKPRCTLQVHPDDADRLGLVDGGSARVASRVGELVVTVEIDDAVAPGVVCLPHGWGHDRPGTRTRVASAHAGVNSNVLTDELAMDPLSGNAVLNGIPVTVARCS